MPENSQRGRYVGTLAAINPENGATTFTLTNNAGGRFAISGNNIVVANGANLDFEATASHTVTVQATGPGGPATKTFTITVTNENEAPSGLALSNAILSLPTTPGFVVGTLSSFDPDAGGSVRYSMGENGHGKFTVVGNEVRVTDPQQFAWDPQPSYRVQVFAQDQGGLITSAWFTITIA